MVTLLRLTHLVTLVVLPPAFATLAAHAARSIGGGEARCAAELDLPTPGFICAAGLDLLFSALVFTSFHLVIALPLAWWAARVAVTVPPTADAARTIRPQAGAGRSALPAWGQAREGEPSPRGYGAGIRRTLR